MKKRVETFLPLFSGFYDSIWDDLIERELEYLFEEGDIVEGYYDYSVDYTAYSKSITRSIENVLDDLDLDIEVKFQELRSPKYYNYSTDSINVELYLDFDKFISKIEENRDEVAQIIKERYSDRDGFFSHHSNEYENWMEDLKSDFENENHKVGAMLDILCEIEEVKECDAMDKFFCNDSVYDYLNIINELPQKLEEVKEELLIDYNTTFNKDYSSFNDIDFGDNIDEEGLEVWESSNEDDLNFVKEFSEKY